MHDVGHRWRTRSGDARPSNSVCMRRRRVPPRTCHKRERGSQRRSCPLATGHDHAHRPPWRLGPEHPPPLRRTRSQRLHATADGGPDVNPAVPGDSGAPPPPAGRAHGAGGHHQRPKPRESVRDSTMLSEDLKSELLPPCRATRGHRGALPSQPYLQRSPSSAGVLLIAGFAATCCLQRTRPLGSVAPNGLPAHSTGVAEQHLRWRRLNRAAGVFSRVHCTSMWPTLCLHSLKKGGAQVYLQEFGAPDAWDSAPLAGAHRNSRTSTRTSRRLRGPAHAPPRFVQAVLNFGIRARARAQQKWKLVLGNGSISPGPMFAGGPLTAQACLRRDLKDRQAIGMYQ